MRATPPDRGLFSTVPFRAYWLRVGRGPGSPAGLGAEGVAAIATTFLVLVFFLLPLFSASGETICCFRPVDLPVSRHGQPIGDPGPVVSIYPDLLTIESVQVGRVDEISAGPEPAIEELAVVLRNLKEYHRRVKPERTGVPALYIQADRDTPFVLLRKVMTTATAEGFTRFELVVTSG
jgi:biopolymer transport protein ExbD